MGERYDVIVTASDGVFPLVARAERKQGRRVALTFRNHMMMWHPMHPHGHTFQARRQDGRLGPRKDTVIVRAMESVTVDLHADKPGRSMLHCHNAYHVPRPT